MATINYTAAEINALLGAAQTAEQPDDVNSKISTAVSDAVSGVNNTIGDLTQLKTADKDSVVDAVNENFTSASEGKAKIAAALLAKGQSAAATDTFDALAGDIGNLQPANYVDPSAMIQRHITNDTAVSVTGTYATSTYYNTDFGVKVGYCPNGDITITMRSGTSTTYENLAFFKLFEISGVDVIKSSESWGTTNPAGQIYSCIITGLTVDARLEINMDERNGTYDYVRCWVVLEAV